MAIKIKPTSSNGSNYFLLGRDKQLESNSRKECKDNLQKSCRGCPNVECDSSCKRNCIIYNAYLIRMEYLESYTKQFIENCEKKYSKARYINWLDEQFDRSCERCRKCQYIDDCSNCKAKSSYVNKLAELIAEELNKSL